MGTVDPVRRFGGDGVSAAATLFSDSFAAATVCDPDIVTNTTTVCATRNRQVSLHF